MNYCKNYYGHYINNTKVKEDPYVKEVFIIMSIMSIFIIPVAVYIMIKYPSFMILLLPPFITYLFLLYIMYVRFIRLGKEVMNKSSAES